MTASGHFTPLKVHATSIVLGGPPDELRAKFFQLATRRDVAHLLDVPYWQFDWLVRRAPTHARYRQFSIPKRRGGVRVIHAPTNSLKILQRKLLQVLSAVFRPRSSVMAFCAEGGIHKNAQAHVRRRWVLNVDLEDFFPTINFGRVRGMFHSKPYGVPLPAATALAQICCHGGQLPQGAPTSPIVSNMICARLDGELIRLAGRRKVSYTRYADDLTFSTWMPGFPSTIARLETGATVLGPEITGILQSNGFTPNPQKVRLQPRGSRQEVTGLIVNEFPNVKRRYVRQVRAMLHAWEAHGLAKAQAEFGSKWDRKHRAGQAPDFRRVVRGKLQHLEDIRGRGDELVQRLWARMSNLDPSVTSHVVPSWRQLAASAMFVIESDVQGTGFLLEGVGMVTCEHILRQSAFAFKPDSPATHYALSVRHSCAARDLAVATMSPTPRHAALSLAPSFRGDVGDDVCVAGFGNFCHGDTGQFVRQVVTGRRIRSTVPHVQTTGPIVSGMSGGPVVNTDGRVVGVVVTGADDPRNVPSTEKHAFIHLDALRAFLSELR
ncbi:MAG: trypsin-like peptidase domain-containing protein [Polyangiaceae bacterium]|nr:trypsin-like peptidase domain-containing protein [Polyangiaceae bacterium]